MLLVQYSVELWALDEMKAFVVFLSFLFHFAVAKPVHLQKGNQMGNISTTSEVIDFMKRFGYLGKPGSPTEDLLTENAVVDGIMRLQTFARLPPTGRIDDATLEILNTPRCGNPDFNEDPHRKKRFVFGSEGWKKRKITYHLANWTPKLGNQSVIEVELAKAFKVWSDYSRLEFVRSEEYRQSDIVISFGRYAHGDGYPFDGPGFVLAHAYYPYEQGSLGGDIHFDEDENWTIKSEDAQSLDFFTVAVHEIGHALGLAHSSVYESIMFPYYQGGSTGFALGYDDILAMYQLYITRPLEEEKVDESATISNDSISSTVPTFPTFSDDVTTSSSTSTTTSYFTISSITTTTSSTTYSTTSTILDRDKNETTLTYEGDILNTEETTTLTYQGDVEDVEEHLKRQEMKEDVSICNGNFDAITSLRNEVFIFKGLMMWRFSQRGKIRPGYPAPFKQMFVSLPDHIKKVDAVYERPGDNYILFFTGSQVWIFDGQKFFAPQNLSYLGLPSYVDRLDDVFVWGKNGKTYLFYQNLYWRFDERSKTIEEGYPQDISRWNGVPRNLDAVFTSVFDGNTYFFKGKHFWSFDDESIATTNRQEIHDYWIDNC